MNPERPFHQGRLRRLSPGFYRGFAWVHWTMNLIGRATGWHPVRGKRVEFWRDWEYSGCLVVGYPDLDPRDEDFP